MVSITEIIQDVKKINSPPSQYNCIESNTFICISLVLDLFTNKVIDKEQAVSLKDSIVARYIKDSKEYEADKLKYEKHLDNMEKSRDARNKLHDYLLSREPIDEDRDRKSVV